MYKVIIALLMIYSSTFSIERKDNIYVKGFYGNGYSEQRYSHIDYIKNYYGENEKEQDDLETHIEEYCDDIYEYNDGSTDE